MSGAYEVIGKIVFSAGVYTVWSMILGAVANVVMGNFDAGKKFSFVPPWVFGMILFAIWATNNATL